ncbi:MAG: OmpA family protein [Opitutales bacterium]
MKKFSQAFGTLLAASALFLTACSKKPVHGPQDATQTGPIGVNPNQEAVPLDNNLQTRTTTADDLANANKSVVDPVYFDFDRSAVPARERAKIEAAVKWMKDNPDRNMVLEGHCDWRGTAEYNLGLGDRRANAVRKYLESLGIDPKRLETLSKGSTDAKQTGGESEWQKDRRVDFLALKHP